MCSSVCACVCVSECLSVLPMHFLYVRRAHPSQIKPTSANSDATTSATTATQQQQRHCANSDKTLATPHNKNWRRPQARACACVCACVQCVRECVRMRWCAHSACACTHIGCFVWQFVCLPACIVELRHAVVSGTFMLCACVLFSVAFCRKHCSCSLFVTLALHRHDAICLEFVFNFILIFFLFFFKFYFLAFFSV